MAYHSNGYSGDERELDRDDMDRNEDGNKPTYLMEHLATFTVTNDTGIKYPADGMRRLLQLEKTNGIWSQKMQLCLDRSMVLIMDYETGSVMERFTGKSIKEPTAFTSQDPMEMYNNILVFIVTNSNPSHPPEMHIFQCQSISAQDLVEDLKELQKGNNLSRMNKSIIPPQSHKPPPQPVISTSRDYRESDSELTGNNDDTSSTTSEQYERDVMVLNHCFDDIEKFIARLQHAAAASKELERRRRSRKSKKTDNGDGMLTMRTKPPQEKEFFDIFQKFKLSFNLLAKLKSHIHDPNAPELVHFLFTPLALIVEASHDTYFDLHLPHKVVSPLLTREAINLLINCVTSKETELWQSLGDTWQIPRDEWKGHINAYHPVFLDNWSPDYPVVDEQEPDTKHYRDSHNDGHYSDYDYDPPTQQENMFYDRNNDHGHGGHHDQMLREGKIEPERELDPNISASRSDISADSIEHTGHGGPGVEERSFKRIQENWLDSLNKRNAQVVQVTYPRTANNDKELTVVRGEFLEILDDSRKWWKARNHKSMVAHVPHTIVSKINYQSSPHMYNNPVYNSGPHYSPRNRPESSSDRFSERQSPGGADLPPSVPAADWDRVRKERLDVPQPPPPPPPPSEPNSAPSTPTPFKRTNSVKSNAPLGGEKMQDELNLVLAMFREKEQKRTDITVRPTPEVFISIKSNPEEVQNWLKAKEFTPNTCMKFSGRTGHELFALSRNELENVCGDAEGKRLDSQLNIQKSVCGYMTIRSTELKTILAKAREKIEKNE